jgi:hypothetical protein
MSALIQNKLATICGALGNSSTTTVVDAAGNLKTSPQFLTLFVVDYAGNLGAITVPPSAIGYFNFPNTTHVRTWVSDFQNITANTAMTANATIGALVGYSIIHGGVISGGFTFRVAGPSTTLGPFNGGGTVILTANNTNMGGAGTIDAGAELQMGLNPTVTSGITNSAFAINGTLTMYGAYTSATNVVGAGNTLGATGVVNIEGPNVNGQGIINFATNTTAAGSVINIKDAFTSYPSTTMAGTWNVNDGSTISLANNYTGIVRLNSCTGGWVNGSGVEFPNMITAPSGRVFVGACGGSQGPNTTTGSFTSSSTYSGSGPLRIGTRGNTGGYQLQGNATAYSGTMSIFGGQVQPTGTAIQGAQIRLGNPTSLLPSGPTGSTISVRSVQSALPTDTTARLFISLVGLNVTNQLPEPYYGTFAGASNSNLTIQAGNFQIATTTGALTPANLVIAGSARVGGHGGSAKVGGPLIISTANGGLSLLTKPSTLAVTTFTASSGFKVDIGPNYAASPGTYDILTRTVAGTNTIPTVGTNQSGLTPTFAWVGNILRMTLI